MARRDPSTWPVYGGMAHHPMPRAYRNQVRVIICAPSGAAARRAAEAAGLRLPRGDWDHSWCETSNKLELAVAHATPEIPLYQPVWGGPTSYPRGTWLPWKWAWPEPGEALPERRQHDDD